MLSQPDSITTPAAPREWALSSAPLLTGSVLPSIAGYRLVRRLAEGRRSTVWHAHDLQRKVDVALKLVDRTSSNVSFAREFDLARSLPRPRIVQALEHGGAAGVAYLAMEYMPGGSLVPRLGKPLAPAEALAVLRDAALALSELHARHLVHRDVKPANLLLRADGRVALGDFGLAARRGNAAGLPAGSIVGTPLYVAPEQSQGAPAQPAADVYSLGVLFHELLCGRPPFSGETVTELLSQHLVAAVPPLTGALAPLQPLAAAMLHKDASRRLPDADAVLQQMELLDRAEFGRPSPAGPPAKGGTP